MSKVLSFEDFIASASKITFVTVKTEEGDIRLGSLTPIDINDYNEMRETLVARLASSAALIAKSLVNAEGQRIGIAPGTLYKEMADADRGKIAQLQKMNLAVSESLLRAIFKLNNLGQDAAVVAKNG